MDFAIPDFQSLYSFYIFLLQFSHVENPLLQKADESDSHPSMMGSILKVI